MDTLKQGAILNGKAYRYTIEKVLGQGSFGVTYLASTAIEGPLGQVSVSVAVKEFFAKELNARLPDGTVSSASSGDLAKKYMASFQREATNLSHLNYPGIVKVLESFSANGTFYYSMEYLKDGSLDDYVKVHGIPEDEAIKLALKISDALSYIHSKKMMHLDLKPKNIMMKDKSTPIVIDFGLSKQYLDSGEPESSSSIGLGTPGYAPLEQSNSTGGRLFKPTIDVYALGATLYKMLTGKTPPAASVILNEGFDEQGLRSKGVSSETVSVIRAAMEPVVSKRIKSVEEFRSLLSRSESPEEEDTLHTGTLKVTSKPVGANLIIDGVLSAKKTPTIITDLTPGKHIVSLEKEGYVTQKSTVLIQADRTTECSLILKHNEILSPVKEVKNRSKILPYALIASVLVILGILGAIFFGRKGHRSRFDDSQYAFETVLGDSVELSESLSGGWHLRRSGTVTEYWKDDISFKMIRVEGGEFNMGSNLDSYEKRAIPVHKVTVSDFSIGETEVTQGLWEAIMGANPSEHKLGQGYPVENVSYDDALSFIERLNSLTGGNFRLPTEAEWEFAARGGNASKNTLYSGSDELLKVGWYQANSPQVSAQNPRPWEAVWDTPVESPVASLEPNELGLYDMSGNVWEWCSDWYGPYSSEAQTDPTGPSSGTYRVNRGGSCQSSYLYCRFFSRSRDLPSKKSVLGLRLASSTIPE